ncbi:MAG: ribosome maturation factor RimM [Candidatus Neomarinimicrobiota bacterium]
MSKISLIPFGLLVKPHGLKGYISIRFFNKESKLLNENDRVFFENDINNFLTIKNINYNSKNNLIRFFEYMNRNDVEKFNNTEIYVDKNVFPELLNDQNYFVDFIGCKLFDQNDKEIGLIKDVIPINLNDVIAIDTENGEKYVPFAKELIMFFDKDKKKLVMTIHKGII